MSARPLPDDLGSMFAVADARAAGVSESRLRGKDLSRPFRGMRATGARTHASGPSDVEMARSAHFKKAMQYSLVMPQTQFFTHVTAAIMWDFPLPVALVLGSTGLDVGELHLDGIRALTVSGGTKWRFGTRLQGFIPHSACG